MLPLSQVPRPFLVILLCWYPWEGFFAYCAYTGYETICLLSCYHNLDEGDLYTWGTDGKTGRLGHGDFEHCFEPRRVKMPQEKDGHKVIVHDVALGQDGALAIVETK